jgi:hypothetical protein
MKQEMENQGGMPTDMQQILASLRDIVPIEWNPNAIPHFDESIREHEWEVALHVVCDYLLEAATPPAQLVVIEQILILHRAMGIEDTCVADLRRKAGKPASQ